MHFGHAKLLTDLEKFGRKNAQNTVPANDFSDFSLFEMN